jgi:hypothetical protein
MPRVVRLRFAESVRLPCGGGGCSGVDAAVFGPADGVAARGAAIIVGDHRAAKEKVQIKREAARRPPDGVVGSSRREPPVEIVVCQSWRIAPKDALSTRGRCGRSRFPAKSKCLVTHPEQRKGKSDQRTASKSCPGYDDQSSPVQNASVTAR